jgi:hypothetical protein
LSQNPKAVKKRAYDALNREKIRAAARAWYAKNPEKGYPGGWDQRLIITARSNSKKYKRDITIDADFLRALWQKQNGRCYWSGVHMEVVRRTPWVVSLDRLDNSRGYEPDNVVLCVWVMNRARNVMTAEDFSETLQTLAMALGEWVIPRKGAA